MDTLREMLELHDRLDAERNEEWFSDEQRVQRWQLARDLDRAAELLALDRLS